MNQRNQIIETIGSIPSLPPATIKLLPLLKDPEAKIEEVGRLIEMDPALATNVLRLANSSMFGVPRTVTTVKQAVVLIGTRQIYDLVISASVRDITSRPVVGYDLSPGDLWLHSLAVGHASAALGKALKVDVPAHTFISGLLHDIGKLVLGTFLQADSQAVTRLAFEENLSFEIAEQQVLGIDHAEVGALLLESWDLPDAIVQVVRWHHQPDGYQGQETSVIDLVHAAELMCTLTGIGVGSEGSNYETSNSVLAHLDLRPAVIETVLCQTMSALESVEALQPESSGS